LGHKGEERGQGGTRDRGAQISGGDTEKMKRKREEGLIQTTWEAIPIRPSQGTQKYKGSVRGAKKSKWGASRGRRENGITSTPSASPETTDKKKRTKKKRVGRRLSSEGVAGKNIGHISRYSHKKTQKLLRNRTVQRSQVTVK